MDYAVRGPVADAEFELYFYSQDGVLQCQMTSRPDIDGLDLMPGEGAIEFSCEELGLQPGRYYIDTAIVENDWQARCATLRVDPGKVVRGGFYMPHRTRQVSDMRAVASVVRVASAPAAT
jgi:hypothetical protein